VFTAWLLREAEGDADFGSLVSEAATREGAQQDFQTVAILGFGADGGKVGADQAEVLMKGLRRQAGREAVIDGLPVAFCSDAVGILGVALGTKAVADTDITGRVVMWASKFLRSSYDAERTENWQRCLFAAADRQLGSPLNLSVPKSSDCSDVRAALLAKGVIGTEDGMSDQEGQHTLRLAMGELPDELPYDRAALRLLGVESVIQASVPLVGRKNAAVVPERPDGFSDRDARVHDAVGRVRFLTLGNAEIMRDASVKKAMLGERLKPAGDAARRCLDRIRKAKGYPSSLDIKENRATPK
jgi:hypothetical protein